MVKSMHKKWYRTILIILVAQILIIMPSTLYDHNYCLHKIYPFNSFKQVVDTCMRSYSDMLVIQDRITNHDRIDENLDLLVGRFMRLQSYIAQLVYAYKYEATVTFDELTYLLQLLDYLQLTLMESKFEPMEHGLNVMVNAIKQDLKQALGLLSFYPLIPNQSLHYRCQPSKCPLHQFA